MCWPRLPSAAPHTAHLVIGSRDMHSKRPVSVLWLFCDVGSLPNHLELQLNWKSQNKELSFRISLQTSSNCREMYPSVFCKYEQRTFGFGGAPAPRQIPNSRHAAYSTSIKLERARYAGFVFRISPNISTERLRQLHSMEHEFSIVHSFELRSIKYAVSTTLCGRWDWECTLHYTGVWLKTVSSYESSRTKKHYRGANSFERNAFFPSTIHAI